MRRLASYFLRGLVALAPLVITLYVIWAVFTRVDRWLGIPIPGVGFVLTVAVIILVGFLASTLLARGILEALERLFQRLPFVRLLYNATKDFFDAFMGERRRFDRPVAVAFTPGSPARILGFVTRESLEQIGLAGYVGVYLPQAYNFGGNLVAVPAEQVTPLAADSATVMALIVSGGVSGG